MESVIDRLGKAIDLLSPAGFALLVTAGLAALVAAVWSFIGEGLAYHFAYYSPILLFILALLLAFHRFTPWPFAAVCVLLVLAQETVLPAMEQSALAPVGEVQTVSVTDIQVIPGLFRDTYRLETSAGVLTVLQEPGITKGTEAALVAKASKDGFLDSRWLCKDATERCVKISD